MVVNDPISDMLTRIRNAVHAKHDKVTVPYSGIKEALARVLASEGFLKAVDVAGEGTRKSIVIDLKYMPDGEPVFRSLERTSKLGRRCYIGASDIRPNRQGVGVAILTTSKGVMKDVDAKRQGLGGEVLCTAW
ncbi:MAG: 30S ribosomal protein S8 [Proteobacteria bacterium]|nr:30S ribosomal protein S8 [Pseudomonadota bacterium]